MKVRGSPVLFICCLIFALCAMAVYTTPECQANQLNPVTVDLTLPVRDNAGGGSTGIITYNVALPDSLNRLEQAASGNTASTKVAYAVVANLQTECSYVMIGNGLGNANWPATPITETSFAAISGASFSI